MVSRRYYQEKPPMNADKHGCFLSDFASKTDRLAGMKAITVRILVSFRSPGSNSPPGVIIGVYRRLSAVSLQRH
jgi:hypothetical protein